MKQRPSGLNSEWLRPLGRIQRPEQIAFKSRWQGPLIKASSRQRGLLLCELCKVTYLYSSTTPFDEECLGFRNTSVIAEGHFLSARHENDSDIVLTFRASEPGDWVQFVAEQKMRWGEDEGLGRILYGLKRPCENLWGQWQSAFAADETRSVWFTGHSLGGAVALITANQCLISPLQVEPAEVHTFGMPRAGDRKYRNHSRVSHLRWVRDHDPVPHLPPAWSGWWHAGRETRLNVAGRELTLTRWERTMVLFEEIWRAMRGRKSRLWQLDEHTIDTYVDTLWEAVLREEEAARK